jgi:TonB family protein
MKSILVIITLNFLLAASLLGQKSKNLPGKDESCLYHYDSLQQRSIYDFADEKAVFPGGERALFIFIQEHLKFPGKDCAEGTVFVQFVVEVDGSISHKSVRKSLNPDLEKEAMRVVDQMPNWSPAKCEGKSVPYLVTIPVKFYLR